MLHIGENTLIHSAKRNHYTIGFIIEFKVRIINIVEPVIGLFGLWLSLPDINFLKGGSCPNIYQCR